MLASWKPIQGEVEPLVSLTKIFFDLSFDTARNYFSVTIITLYFILKISERTSGESRISQMGDMVPTSEFGSRNFAENCMSMKEIVLGVSLAPPCIRQ